MNQFSSVQTQLLSYLADGLCHSGSSLGEQLGISRTAVWKQIKQLTLLGVPIHRLPQQGYQLAAGFKLLSSESINNHLKQRGFNTAVDLHVFTTIDSTNNYLKNCQKSSQTIICTAEKQTHGRGRFGRQWVSPFGENIYLSSRWHLNCCLSKLSGLSLIVSLAIHDCLLKNSVEDIWVKWPNDLMWNHKKLCGVLIEVIAETNGNVQVIIGVGLNVNSIPQDNPLIDKPWCSLFQITGHYFDRNVLIADLLFSLNHYLQKFMESDFSAFQNQWQKIDYLAGHLISVSHLNGEKKGYAKGVSGGGHLCLIDDQGVTHELASGDTSLLGIEG